MSASDVSQLLTLGKRYTSARDGFGMVIMPRPGRATVHFTLFADGPRHHTLRSTWFYLNEYKEEDPRIRALLKGARTLHRSAYRLVLRDAPARTTRPGFVAVGDAVAPGGHMGILPAIYMGRHAALVAAEALDAGDFSTRRLAPIDNLFRRTIVGSLEAEDRVMQGVADLSDEELDRLCQALNRLNPIAPPSGAWRTIPWQTVNWMANQAPLRANDWELLQRVLVGGQNGHRPELASPTLLPLAQGARALLR